MGELVDLCGALSQKQSQAVLLMAQGFTAKEIAAQLGLATGTVHNWKSQNHAFQRQLSRLQADLFSEGVGQLRALVSQAAATLRQILQDTSATAVVLDGLSELDIIYTKSYKKFVIITHLYLRAITEFHPLQLFVAGKHIRLFVHAIVCDSPMDS